MAYESGEGPKRAPEPKLPTPPPQTGLLAQWLSYSDELPSPYTFRCWAGLWAIGSAVERRVWSRFGRLTLYPNLFVFLVGPPGTGKTVALEPITQMLRKSQACLIAPNDITKQGLLDALANSKRGGLIEGKPFDYHYMAIAIRELSNFMPKFDPALGGLLTDIFDCPALNEEQKRGQGKESSAIQSPGFSFIVGTATKNLGNSVGPEVMDSGFMARIVMVFSDEQVVPVDMFAEVAADDVMAERIVGGLRKLGELVGPMTWEPATKIALQAFREVQAEGAPMHNQLTQYVTRRWLHLAKLCMVSALCDWRMNVTESDFYRASGWLLEAEAYMTEIFKDMVSHADGAIYEELRSQIQLMFMRSRSPVPAQWLYAWLSKRVASSQIPRMIEVAEAGGFIIRAAGTSGYDAEFFPGNPAESTPKGTV